MISAQEMLSRGGEWLGRARAWMQTHKHNGSTVKWGTEEALSPPMTVRQVEEVAAYAAGAALESAELPKLVEDLHRAIQAGRLRKAEGLSVSEDFDTNMLLQRLERLRFKGDA